MFVMEDHKTAVPILIESEQEHEEALNITRELMQKRPRTSGETKLLKTWSVLIQDYERRRYPEMFRKSEPRDVLRFLIEENGLTQADIPSIPQSRISDILNGRRNISVSQARVLGDFFKTNFALFLK
jgi:HTH-type transcriptional regulator / antitoxin HigA